MRRSFSTKERARSYYPLAYSSSSKTIPPTLDCDCRSGAHWHWGLYKLLSSTKRRCDLGDRVSCHERPILTVRPPLPRSPTGSFRSEGIVECTNAVGHPTTRHTFTATERTKGQGRARGSAVYYTRHDKHCWLSAHTARSVVSHVISQFRFEATPVPLIPPPSGDYVDTTGQYTQRVILYSASAKLTPACGYQLGHIGASRSHLPCHRRLGRLPSVGSAKCHSRLTFRELLSGYRVLSS